MGHFFPRNKPSNNMKAALFGLCLLVLVSVPQLDATVAITVGTLALTAPQVTGLIALKALALGKGFLIGRLLSRGKRSTERFNIVEEVETDIVNQIASNELEQCTQLLFCATAADANISLAKDVDELRRLVTRVPGKYKKAHQIGKLSGSEKCVKSYDCSIKLENLVDVINSL